MDFIVIYTISGLKSTVVRADSRSRKVFFQAVLDERRPPTGGETAHFVEAIVRRVVRVSMWGVVVAMIPVMFVIWQTFLLSKQNVLIKKQNEYFQEQNTSIRQQITFQERQENIARRAQLVEAMYDITKNIRVRAESAIAFVKLEKNDTLGIFDNFNSLDLSYINLNEADLSFQDFSNVNFRDANLQDANFSGANLQGAYFGEANLGNIQNWRQIQNIQYTNIYGIKNVPEGFREWGLEQGAVEIESNEEWNTYLKKHNILPK